jgi:hypothetical protein
MSFIGPLTPGFADKLVDDAGERDNFPCEGEALPASPTFEHKHIFFAVTPLKRNSRQDAATRRAGTRRRSQNLQAPNPYRPI